MSTLIKEYELAMSLTTLYEHFWLDASFTKDFMANEMKELNVKVSEWKQDGDQFNREVDSEHHPKYACPGFHSLAGVTSYNSLIHCMPLTHYTLTYIVTYSKQYGLSRKH